MTKKAHENRLQDIIQFMKSRLTITLPDALLTQVDDLVDKQTIRNRSHAIEHLIRQSLTPQVSTTLILAGGKKHTTENPLLKPINGDVLLIQMLRHLTEYGIKHVIFCVNKGDTKLEEFCKRRQLAISIDFSYEQSHLGTAGALKQAEKHLKNDNPFLVIHGDILTDIKLDEVFDFHLQESAQATIIVKPKLGMKQYGQVFIQGNRVTTFSEAGTDSGISLINTGVYVLSKEVLQLISAKKPTFLETDIFPYLAKKNQLRAYFFQGLWYDISTPAHYQEAVSDWQNHA